MIKKELMEKLKEFPDDSPVYFRIDRVSYPVAHIREEKIGGLVIVNLMSYAWDASKPVTVVEP